jgi:hypothetical protein
MPVFEYDHSQGCSITGGGVYRGSAMPSWQGVYFVSDYCTGHVWTLRRAENGEWQNAIGLETGFSVTSFGEDEAGELYLLDYSGSLYRIVEI